MNWVTRNLTVGAPTAVWDVVEPVDGQRMANTTSSRSATGSTTTYLANGWRGYVHSVTMTGLAPGVTYFYSVGDSGLDFAWSQPRLSFKAPPTPGTLPLRIALLGDMGASDVSDHTINRILSGDRIDMVLHVGDIGYADMEEQMSDAFSRKVEPLAATTMYHLQAGNHESFMGFVGYFTRWPSAFVSNPNKDNLFYSFDYGGVHILALNTEAENDFATTTLTPGAPQYEFALQDLTKAAANRAAVPFIVVITHRPFVCSNDKNHACTTQGPKFLTEIGPLFDKFKVDLVVSGHRHDYERSYPMASNMVVPQKNYVNPPAPVYIVNGAAGCNEHLQGKYTPVQPDWSAVRLGRSYGFAYLDLLNSTTLQWRFIESDTGNVLDQFTLTKQ